MLQTRAVVRMFVLSSTQDITKQILDGFSMTNGGLGCISAPNCADINNFAQEEFELSKEKNAIYRKI